MQAKSVRDLGALVRSARRAQEMTQADLAAHLNVSRDWVVRLEQGHPRLEAQRVLDALGVLGLVLDVHESQSRRPAVTSGSKARLATTKTRAADSTSQKGPVKGTHKRPAKTAAAPSDPFDRLFRGR